MKVSTLIKKLQTMPPDAEVLTFINLNDGYYGHSRSVHMGWMLAKEVCIIGEDR